MSENKDFMEKAESGAEVIVEDKDSEYENLLNKFENPSENNKSKGKKNSHIKALILSLIGAVVLAGIVCLLIFLPQNSEESTYEEASVKSAVDSDNVWQASLETDKNGRITTNGSGTLLEFIPSDIKNIKVENNSGSFTITSYTPKKASSETDPDTGKTKEETDTTQYTLLGFEDFELQSGVPDEIASACTTLEFNTVIKEDASKNLADYGLDKPRSVVTVTYNDKTKALITVGNDSPRNSGTYIMFGSGNTVYLCDTDSVSALLYGVNDLISLTINNSASNSENSDFSNLTLSGSAFGKNISMELNSDTKHISNAYVLTAPERTYADDAEASGAAGAVRGLYADSVACVNPTAKQLNKYGLSNIYAHIVAKYPDTTVNLIASKPDSKGNCYLMKNGGNVVYKIASASIPWVTSSYDKLISKYILNPQLTGLTGMSVTCNSKTYDFNIKTTVTKTTDDKGSTTSSTTTATKYKGNELTQGNFEIFLQNVSLLTKADTTASNPSGTPVLTVEYSYTGSRGNDVIKFYKGSSNKYTVTLNSKAVGTVYSTYVEKLITQTPQVAKDKEVKTFW